MRELATFVDKPFVTGTHMIPVYLVLRIKQDNEIGTSCIQIKTPFIHQGLVKILYFIIRTEAI